MYTSVALGADEIIISLVVSPFILFSILGMWTGVLLCGPMVDLCGPTCGAEGHKLGKFQQTAQSTRHYELQFT